MFSLPKYQPSSFFKVQVQRKFRNDCQRTNCKTLNFGILALAVGLLLLFSSGLFIEYISASFFILTPNSVLKNLWIKSPVPLGADIYLFNWTNSHRFFDVNVKPKFEEVGPYRFLQTVEKVNLTWHQNDTVSFKLLKTFYQDDHIPNANVTTLNFITTVIVHIIKDWNIIIKKGASMVMNSASPNIYLTKTVKEFIVEGVEDIFLFMGQLFPFIWTYLPRFERLGVVAVGNNSENFNGIINMVTGVNRNFNINTWNYDSRTPYFKKWCGQVRGHLDLFGHNLSKDYITVFVPEMCRYIKFDYLTEVTVKGILGYKYAIAASALDNGTIINENNCFCDKKCTPSGMLSLSSCRYGLPFYASLPHFYQADPVYLEAVEGLEPNEHKHEGYIVIEPMTGIPLSVSIGIQINILLQPTEGIELYEYVRTIYFPMFWIKMYVTLPDVYALALKIYLHLPWILTIVSVAFILLGIYCILIKKKMSTKREQNNTNNRKLLGEPFLNVNETNYS